MPIQEESVVGLEELAEFIKLGDLVICDDPKHKLIGFNRVQDGKSVTKQVTIAKLGNNPESRSIQELRLKLNPHLMRVNPASEEAIQNIEAKLKTIEANYRQLFASASTPEALNTARACTLGKQSDFTEVLRMMGDVPADRKREMGGRINAFRADVESAYHARLVQI